jgi:hypothetical protein
MRQKVRGLPGSLKAGCPHRLHGLKAFAYGMHRNCAFDNSAEAQ